MPRTPSTSFPSELPDQIDEILADEISAPMIDPAAPLMLAKGTRADLTDRARAAQATQREHVTLIAHDVRTPLSIISLEAELLANRVGEQPGVKASVERILHNVAYIDRLVGDLLDFASVEAGRLELRTEQLDLARLVVETLDRTVPAGERPRVRVQVRHRAHVLGDPSRLERVISNLMSNAFKYSNVSSPVTVTLELEQRRARVCVSDQGIGMTPEQARTVFDRGRRTDGARDRDGYGLGLYISRKIIDAHRGRIGVASSPGCGSRFFFELPLVG